MDLTTPRLCIAGRKKFYEIEPNILSFKHEMTQSLLRTKSVLQSIKYKLQRPFGQSKKAKSKSKNNPKS